jgi:ABC-type multidrug transport system ATPase subunit
MEKRPQNNESDSDALVEAEGVNKSFKRRRALIDATFKLPKGQVMGLVGPNGSGKTTLLRLTAGFMRPTSGRLRVHGMNPWKDRVAVMRHTRFAFAPPALYPNLTARETLRALGGLRHAGAQAPTPAELDRALDTVGLADRADDRVGVFSFGMRQRLALAQALLPVPTLLILDEPTDGLDPLAILELRAVLGRLCREQGVTILLSSHLLTEAETLLDTLLVLHEGRIMFSGTPDELLRSKRELCVHVNGPDDAIQRARLALNATGAQAEIRDGRLWAVAGTLDLATVIRILEPHDIQVCEFYEQRPTLEQAVIRRLLEAGDGSSTT